jgi:L-ornithine N5-oxygenase
VAKSLERVRVQYGRRCVAVTPQFNRDGGVAEWLIQLADDSEIVTPNLVVGAGRDAYVPPQFAALPRERVVHSTEFADRIGTFEATGAHRFVVIGGAQSAAEILWALHQDFPAATSTMIMRSIGLNAYESSKFTNELFYPSYIDTFHGAAPAAREQLLREMHRTNYSGLAPGLLDSLYKQMYVDKLNGCERLSMLTMTDIVDARLDGDEIVLTLLDRSHGGCNELRCDAVMLGTGFVREMPRAVRDLAAAACLDEVRVTRHYRLDLPESSTAACYLQGVNEATHGIADSLLSVLATRSEEIVQDLVSRRRRAPQAALAAHGAR